MCEIWSAFHALEETHVTVRTKTDAELTGYLYAVDPETGAIGLLCAGPCIHLIPGENVSNVQTSTPVPGTPTCLPERARPVAPAMDAAVVLAALRRRRIEAELISDGASSVISVLAGAATVSAPFTPEECRSTNESVLRRVRMVLEEIRHEVGGS